MCKYEITDICNDINNYVLTVDQDRECPMMYTADLCSERTLKRIQHRCHNSTDCGDAQLCCFKQCKKRCVIPKGNLIIFDQSKGKISTIR